MSEPNSPTTPTSPMSPMSETTDVEPSRTSLSSTSSGDQTAQDIQRDEKSAKRTTLVQSTAQGSSANRVFLDFYGVNYRVRTQHPEKGTQWWRRLRGRKHVDEEALHYKTILENVHGCAGPGILAIMGQSGSGKTTLLNLLAGRIRNKDVTGTILLNGEKPTKRTKRFVAYCTQHDIFYPLLTVRESLTYTARLRLPRVMSLEEKQQQVENVIQLLNLTKCADTIIGGDTIPGISGGERKRVSIAAELLTDPSVILLDEPTSGLDSSLALDLVKTLKEFALKRSKTIIMVIHQPSSQVFELFDKLILVADGRMVYFGDRRHVVGYFDDVGFKCHNNFNPADHILELLNEPVAKEKLIAAYAHRIVNDDPSGSRVVSQNSCRLKGPDVATSSVVVEHRWEATFKQQVMILASRAFKQRRKVILSRLSLLETFIMSAISCLIWFRLPFEERTLRDRNGILFVTAIYWSFTPLVSTVVAFPLDRNILMKERHARTYRLSSYFIAKQIAELPLVIIQPVIFGALTYWITNLQPNFGLFVVHTLMLMVTVLTAQGFGYFFGAALMNVPQSMTTSTVFMLSSMLLGGFYATNIPSWTYWVSYLSFAKYTFGTFVQIQFLPSYVRYACASVSQFVECKEGGLGYIPGTAVLETYGHTTPLWVNVFCVFVFIFGMRALAYFALRITTRRKR